MSFLTQDIQSILNAVTSSTALASSRFPNSTLKAYAFFKTDGTFISGLNVSSTVRNSAGSYTVTMSNNLGLTYAIDAYCESVGGVGAFAVGCNIISVSKTSGTVIGVGTFNAGALADYSANSVIYVAAYQ